MLSTLDSQPSGTVFNSSISNLSTSYYELAKSTVFANNDVSTPITSSTSDCIAYVRAVSGMNYFYRVSGRPKYEAP